MLLDDAVRRGGLPHVRWRLGLTPMPDADAGRMDPSKFLPHDLLVRSDRDLPLPPATLVPVRLF